MKCHFRKENPEWPSQKSKWQYFQQLVSHSSPEIDRAQGRRLHGHFTQRCFQWCEQSLTHRRDRDYSLRLLTSEGGIS